MLYRHPLQKALYSPSVMREFRESRSRESFCTPDRPYLASAAQPNQKSMEVSLVHSGDSVKKIWKSTQLFLLSDWAVSILPHKFFGIFRPSACI